MLSSGDLAYYVAAFVSVAIFGLSKGGLSALGALGIPILSLAISPVKAAAITLPILIVQDWVGIWAFRRDFDRRNLFILMPASLIGVGAGWLLASRVDEEVVKLAVGLISLGFVAFMLVRERMASGEVTKAEVAPGIFWGAVSGFTSFISHAGAAGFLIYTMPQRLEPRVFAGTSVIFFAAVNLLKIPPYFMLGQFSKENLLQSAALLPVGVLSTLVGIWLTRVIPMDKFYKVVLALTFVVGVKLVFDALTRLL